MAKLITGILAHVDAGKTTLSEALLYNCGAIRQFGRVDSGNTFLDNYNIEKERGITVFSKQAILNDHITLIDTPGHVDFSAEMERTLSILDAAILLINAGDGIQSHTKTLWSLLTQYKIPTVIFVNKMDMPDTNEQKLLKVLQSGLSENIVPFTNENLTNPSSVFLETISACDDALTEKYLNSDDITKVDIQCAINRQNIIPCVFGSALKNINVDILITILNEYYVIPNYSVDQSVFGAVVYKVSKDKQNTRLTHLKVTGGVLKVKEALDDEKINEIRLYSGEKFESVKEVKAGEICTVTGLKNSYAGKTYGITPQKPKPKIEPVLVYSVLPPPQIDTPKMLQIMRDIEEEIPEIKVEYSEQSKEISVRLMGQIQTEVIQQLIKERYQLDIQFGKGKILYKETILEPVIGVGHYEPLRHYAEVHIQLSPLPRGSGLKFVSNLSVDVLDTNWQQLILTHLQEKTHIGVLTGSPITDMELRVVAGRAHLKHTEGGDFRQSTYRAIRHGLMYAASALLEPYYSYEIVVPEACTGRVMSDMEKMHGTCNLNENKGGFANLSGRVPVSEITDYINEVRAYTKGQGTLSLTLDGYELCHNEKQVIEAINYNPNEDLENPAGSVFCAKGAGFTVNWDQVNNYKHLSIHGII